MSLDDDSKTLTRLWVVFFRDRKERWWWDVFTRPGFRHVSAAAWYPSTARWVFYDPTMRATAVQVVEAGPEADALFGQWVVEAGAVLRVRSRQERAAMPAMFGCVGAIKALLGLRSRALAPYGLYRDLLAGGAEIVERPAGEDIGDPVRNPEDTGGRPLHRADA